MAGTCGAALTLVYLVVDVLFSSPRMARLGGPKLALPVFPFVAMGMNAILFFVFNVRRNKLFLPDAPRPTGRPSTQLTPPPPLVYCCMLLLILQIVVAQLLVLSENTCLHFASLAGHRGDDPELRVRPRRKRRDLRRRWQVHAASVDPTRLVRIL